jgi:hypothetical protein
MEKDEVGGVDRAHITKTPSKEFSTSAGSNELGKV